MASVIRNFNTKGTSGPGTTRSGVKVASLGFFDTTRGQIFMHPRVVLNPLRGRGVTVTNPKATPDQAAMRTAGLGMGGSGTTGGVGQRGRSKDVGARGEL